MNIVCLDMEGVLVPEIWIEFAERTGIDEFRVTTREEPDYDKLMSHRIELMKTHGFDLQKIVDVIETIDPLIGAKEFVSRLRESMQVLILSDTFGAFARPLVRKLGWPFIFHNDLVVGNDGYIEGYKLRSRHTKLDTVRGLESCGGVNTIAVGDSYNDLEMLKEAREGFLFHAPERIRKENPEIPAFDEYEDLTAAIMRAVQGFQS